MPKCKITVVKRIVNQDLIDAYSTLDAATYCHGCPDYKEGYEVIVEDFNKLPEGFCSWAWADIQKDVLAVMSGGSFTWMKQKGTNITCCTDGLMPVIFKVERIED